MRNTISDYSIEWIMHDSSKQINTITLPEKAVLISPENDSSHKITENLNIVLKEGPKNKDKVYVQLCHNVPGNFFRNKVSISESITLNSAATSTPLHSGEGTSLIINAEDLTGLEGKYELYIITEKEKLILATNKHKGGRIRIIDMILAAKINLTQDK